MSTRSDTVQTDDRTLVAGSSTTRMAGEPCMADWSACAMRCLTVSRRPIRPLVWNWSLGMA
eukprot:4589806-Prorocentrum_lima.AAC.1